MNSRKFNAVSFFEGGGKIEIKTPRNKLDIEKELIHRSLFGGLLFLETGSLSLAIMNTKTARKSSENETQPGFCNHFWSVSIHLACKVFLCYPPWNLIDVSGRF